jgi:hypothetical protein
MRFMMMVKADRNYEAGAPPRMELMAAMGKLTEDMTKAGVLLETGGLPSSRECVCGWFKERFRMACEGRLARRQKAMSHSGASTCLFANSFLSEPVPSFKPKGRECSVWVEEARHVWCG